MQNRHRNAATQAQIDPRMGRQPAMGKLKWTVECDGLLMLDVHRPGLFIPKPAIDVAQHFQLEALLVVPLIRRIKIKCFHVCGLMKVEDDACLVALWALGDWFVDRYQTVGKSAMYKKRTISKAAELGDPDAVLTISVGERDRNTIGDAHCGLRSDGEAGEMEA